MKKKFLSLMMAAAVVATTSVSAFASTQNITGSVADEKKAQVTVEGKIADDTGSLPVGVYNVTIPSKVVFSVDDHGTFTGVELPIVNNGDDAINIKVADFVDTDGNDTGIKLNTSDDLGVSANKTGKKRSEINLSLQGNVKKVFLGNGEVIDKLGTGSKSLKNEVMAEVAPNETYKLQLSGNAGQDILGAGVSAITNKFALTFKISKKQV